MSDTISRQAAIDAVRTARGKGEAHRMLIQLPSAKPDVPDTNVGDTDCISRQAALKACRNPEYGENCYAYGDDIEKRLKSLPSAQPGWIPCGTALPEHDGEYLVTKKSFGWNCKEYIESDIARYENKDGWHKADQVLAWQLLPTPYREGGQDGKN